MNTVGTAMIWCAIQVTLFAFVAAVVYFTVRRTGHTSLDQPPEKITAILIPAIKNAREAARQAMSANNLKQISLAMLMYEQDKGSFPPAVLYGPNGTTPPRSPPTPRRWKQ